MSDEQKKFRVKSGSTKAFAVKECTGAVYKKIKMAIAKYNATPTNQRVAILKEFGIVGDNVEDQKKKISELKNEEYGVEKYYEQLVNILLIDPDGELEKIKFDDIILGEVNAASDYFFSFLK